MNSEQRQTLLDNALNAVKDASIKNIYFVACGGSKATLTPAQYICDREIDIPSFVYSSNEFVYRRPKGFCADSLVITCSHSGNTPETVEATRIAKESGAITISFMNQDNTDSPLYEATQFPILYSYNNDDDKSEANDGVLLRLIFHILNILSPSEKYERAVKNVYQLDRIIKENKKNTYEAADAFGKNYKRNDVIYTMGSGSCYSAAYAFSICLLMEMLWIHSNAIHSGEFFHGPFEVTDYDVPFILIKNTGETRFLDERAHNFLEKFTNDLIVVDVDNFDMAGIDQDLRSYFAPSVVSAVLRQYADRIAEHKGHPLSVRRYMWKMAY